MEKKYNIPGKVDKPNTKLIKKILALKKRGVFFKDIALEVGRSARRVKDLYYREMEKLSTGEALTRK